jgi:hypothetical protein
VSKYSPVAGDVGVIGTIRNINRNPLFSNGIFNPNVSANGYASAAQNVEAQTGVGCGDVPIRGGVPEGINEGDWVTADILQGNFALYAVNIQPFSW